jgi:protocatechuate 3,4-dioxygenase beta subunit
MTVVLLAGLVLLPLAGRKSKALADDKPAANVEVPSDDKPAPATERVAQAPQGSRPAPRPPENVAEDELAGIVVDEQGNPLSGVAVDAWHWHPGNETKTDASGQFRLKGLDPKHKVEVLITKDGYSPQHFAQQPTGVKEWVIVLGQKTYLEGTVLGTDGKPVGNAQIRAAFGPVQGDGVMISEVPIEGKSREDGTYRLYVPPGVYDLRVSAPGRGVYRQSSVAIDANQAKPLPVRLQEGVRFEARVVDSLTSQPVEGFVLWRWQSPRLVSRSDAQGRIVLEELIPGKTEFQCGGGDEIAHESGVRFFQNGPFGRWWSPDATSEWQRFRIEPDQESWQRNFDDLEFDLRVGMPPVTIVVERGVTVTGRVTDPRGKPVAGATVAPARTGSGNSITGDTRYSVTTEQDGTYRVVLPASNKAVYNLVAHDGQYGQWRNWANGVSEPMQTTPGQTIAGFDLALTEPATVRGRVTIGGRGVGRKDVRAHAFDMLENRYYDPTTQTKEDGTFELKFVRPGKHFVQVEPFWLAAESAPHGSKVVEVKAGEVLEGVELEAAPTP